MAEKKMMQASVLLGKDSLTVESREIPVPAADEVLVKVAAVGVCGSDVHYYREGRIGDFIVNEPMILGHEASGTIVAVGAEVPESRIGERVSIEPQRPCGKCEQCRKGEYNLCPKMEFYATPPIDGAFVEYVTIQSSFAHSIPDSVSDEAAALCEPLSVAVASVRKCDIQPGSTVLVTGAGPIGLICAQTAKAFGASKVYITDVVAEKCERALKYGIDEAINVAETPLEDTGLVVDSFIDATGVASAVYSGIKCVGPSGTVVLVGLGSPDLTLPVDHIQNMELNVTGVFRYVNTWPVAIELVATGKVDLDSLVTGKFDLDHVREALESDRDPDSLKSVVYPGR